MKKRDGRKITINIHLTNRWLYTFIAIAILIAVGVGVYAATYSLSGAGHPYTEISTCSANQVLKMSADGTAWVCSNLPTPTCVPSSDCTNINVVCPSGLCEAVQANCASGYVMTGMTLFVPAGGTGTVRIVKCCRLTCS